MTGPQHQNKFVVVVILSAIYGVNYVDRQIVAILLDPIKAEFGVSDTVLGLLAGPAFALFYATVGVPLAMLADRTSRKRLIAWSLGFFSLMTLACGLAAQFWQLLIARVLTGVGEAGTGPASQSLISDLFRPHERATAQAGYAVGVNVGLMIAFFCGGWIAQEFGWRVAFIAAGLPGLVLVVVLMAFVKEPLRLGKADEPDNPTLVDTVKVLWQRKSFLWLIIGGGLSAFASYGVTMFVPSFLMRSHGLNPADVGLILALFVGLGGGTATFLSGVVADRLSRKDMRWNMYVPAIAALVSLPFWPIVIILDNSLLAIGALAIPLALGMVFIGPLIATVQTLAPVRMRARAAAIQMLIGNLIGLGLGPLVIGFVSDILRPSLGENSLRFALLAGVLASVLSIIAYIVAARSLRKDIETTGEVRFGETGPAAPGSAGSMPT
ncbi:MAG: MFS transporter [Henriciella sp.]|uniref:spinster family MFS transporter n=1 Tax=Henriciella sp. TaxID=1968823 RepID=UPI003C71D29E